MEHLTKQQIVLLTLFVSFVTSIATGIFTVTLMQQAPAAVTQTINKIVERTVEKIVPVESQKAQIIKQEVVTNVIKEDDLVVEAVAENEKSLVRIYGLINEDPAEIFLGYGVVVHDNGVLVTDRKVYAENATYNGIFYGGKKYPLELLRSVEGEQVIFLKPVYKEDKKNDFFAIKTSDSNMLRLGQRIISLDGEKRTAVLSGIITELQEAKEEASTTTKTSRNIESVGTTLASRADIFGSPLINLSAEIVGIYIGNDGSSGRSYLPVNSIKLGISSTTPQTQAPLAPSR